MTSDPESALDLPSGELECLRRIAKVPWFSIRAEGVFERVGERHIRTSAVTIRSSEMAVITSRDIQLSKNQEVFRIAIHSGLDAPQFASSGLNVCGSADAWLGDIGLNTFRPE